MLCSTHSKLAVEDWILGNNLGSKYSLLVKCGKFISYYKRKTFYKKILQKLRPEN